MTAERAWSIKQRLGECKECVVFSTVGPAITHLYWIFTLYAGWCPISAEQATVVAAVRQRNSMHDSCNERWNIFRSTTFLSFHCPEHIYAPAEDFTGSSLSKCKTSGRRNLEERASFVPTDSCSTLSVLPFRTHVHVVSWLISHGTCIHLRHTMKLDLFPVSLSLYLIVLFNVIHSRILTCR